MEKQPLNNQHLLVRKLADITNMEEQSHEGHWIAQIRNTNLTTQKRIFLVLSRSTNLQYLTPTNPKPRHHWLISYRQDSKNIQQEEKRWRRGGKDCLALTLPLFHPLKKDNFKTTICTATRVSKDDSRSSWCFGGSFRQWRRCHGLFFGLDRGTRSPRLSWRQAGDGTWRAPPKPLKAAQDVAGKEAPACRRRSRRHGSVGLWIAPVEIQRRMVVTTMTFD